MKVIILNIIFSFLIINANEINLNSCINCHGNNFEKKALGKSLIVRDMNETIIYEKLIGYKNNKGGLMKGLMKVQIMKYNNEDLKEISIKIKDMK